MEEAALIDGQVLNEVILPMMSVPRRGPNGLVDQDEPHQQQIFITSAGAKTTFAYERLVEMVSQRDCPLHVPGIPYCLSRNKHKHRKR